MRGGVYQRSVAKFIVPGWGDKVNFDIGFTCTDLPGYIGWRAGTTTLCRSQLYPEFGYRYELCVRAAVVSWWWQNWKSGRRGCTVQQAIWWGFQCWSALYQKLNLCIPGKGIVRPQSQLPTFLCLWTTYVFPGSVYIFGCSKIDRPILETYKSLTDIWV